MFIRLSYHIYIYLRWGSDKAKWLRCLLYRDLLWCWFWHRDCASRVLVGFAGRCQERHFWVHHLRTGKPWANGWENSKAYGWHADAKSGQRGKGNGKSCGPAGSELRSSRNPGQRRPSLIIVFLLESSGLQILTHDNSAFWHWTIRGVSRKGGEIHPWKNI